MGSGVCAVDTGEEGVLNPENACFLTRCLSFRWIPDRIGRKSLTCIDHKSFLTYTVRLNSMKCIAVQSLTYPIAFLIILRWIRGGNAFFIESVFYKILSIRWWNFNISV
jgi:hypothetical protein